MQRCRAVAVAGGTALLVARGVTAPPRTADVHDEGEGCGRVVGLCGRAVRVRGAVRTGDERVEVRDGAVVGTRRGGGGGGTRGAHRRRGCGVETGRQHNDFSFERKHKTNKSKRREKKRKRERKKRERKKKTRKEETKQKAGQKGFQGVFIDNTHAPTGARTHGLVFAAERAADGQARLATGRCAQHGVAVAADDDRLRLRRDGEAR